MIRRFLLHLVDYIPRGIGDWLLNKLYPSDTLIEFRGEGGE